MNKDPPGMMEVVAVSQALPQWLDMGGRRVQTSIIHTPLTKPDESILVELSQGIEGNRPAVHNGEVYAFFAHHYDYWAGTLGVARAAWDWCHWGENVTFRCDEQLSEADFHLGDVWRVGKDVLLQVCGSRVPCFKLAWRCGQKDSWLQELASTGKCGVYLKVVQRGRICPGDVAELVCRKSTGPIIDCATITRVAFADALSTRATMDLLVDHPDLLDMNKLVFRRKLSMMHDQALSGKNSWKGWRSVYVSRVVEESPEIKSFHLIPSSGKPDKPVLAAFLPGQFVTVRLPNGLIRSWSLSAYPDEDTREYPDSYRISIRKAGLASTWMHELCKPGTLLDIQSPAGTFCLDWSPQFPGRQVYASAGIGITPMMSMFRAHVQHQAMQRAPAVWIHVSPSIEAMPFWEELEHLLHTPVAQELEVRVILFLTSGKSSGCEESQAKLKEIGKTNISLSIQYGRPTTQALRSLFEDPYMMDPLRIIPIEIEGKYSTVYLCGPTSFEKNMRDILTTLEVPDAMILSEAFSGEGVASSALPIEGSEVRFARSKRTVAWKTGATKDTDKKGDVEGSPPDTPTSSGAIGPTLLELAEDLGLTPQFGCRAGVCGSCEVPLCKGKVTGGLQPGGLVRVCVARPASDKVEIAL
ncbi:Fc.00g115150.m01.CDS01 [Cosmosporella sp. VM-42]